MKITSHHDITWAQGRRIPDAADATSEFEALLVAEVFKQSESAPRFSTLLGDDSSSRMGREMWIEELVSRAVAERGLGLAEAMERTRAVDSDDGSSK